ncbi:rRNA pseudouridine synthase [Alphaproteobacteria bacterium]|nr:rRNA pseudouridine synthase [Alphaproteobacteria bacterium]
MRIAKYISNAGICSRRDAEKLIKNKKVFINNIRCEHPSTLVTPKDKIIVNKKVVKLESRVRLWKMYKPIKFICTNKDPQHRKTVFDLIPKNYPRLISIGRLDFMSEGLLLFTNNGDFARRMELPSSKLLRVYRVCINGSINPAALTKIKNGIKINGIQYNKVTSKIEKYNAPYTWIIFKIREGKNREIRNICEFFSWNIVKLIRIQFSTIKITKQKPGEIVEIKNFSSTL